MQVIQNVVAVLAGIVGLLTALLTLYAKYLDVKKGAADSSKDAPIVKEGAPVEAAPDPVWVEEPVKPNVPNVPPPLHTPDALERAREAVKAPATTLLTAGLVCMLFNLVIAAFGFVDQFVTPLTTESKNKQAFKEAMQRNEVPSPFLEKAEARDGLSDEATVVLTIVTTISLSVASASAAWAGYSMLRLRSYWLSVAGSFAIMAGGCFCCMSGIPIGIWCLSVLYKPEVAASFK